MGKRANPADEADSAWAAQLRQLHDADKAKRQAETAQQLRTQGRQQAEVELMRQSKAHALLRQVQKAYLDGEGVIKVFENVEGCSVVLVLMWQGPISAARVPDRLEEPYSYISVGVKDGRLWVNGKALSKATAEGLRVALLQACKEPAQKRAK